MSPATQRLEMGPLSKRREPAPLVFMRVTVTFVHTVHKNSVVLSLGFEDGISKSIE